MKAKNAAAAIAIGIIGVAFLKNGTANKLTQAGTNFVKYGVGGLSKVSRRI